MNKSDRPQTEHFLKELENFSANDNRKIHDLLKICRNMPPSLEDIWSMMNSVWNETVAGNLNEESLKSYYTHPVWTLNGIFIEQDPVSISHRKTIALWIAGKRKKIKSLLDYGAGYGTFYRMAKKEMPDLNIEIFEPYTRTSETSPSDSISVHEKKYDCIVCIDVMEHLTDPLSTLNQLNNMLADNGYAVFQNCFEPVIKCHLPVNFHLRYTFKLFARMAGFSFYEKIKGSPAVVFRKNRPAGNNMRKIRICERLSRLIYPFFFFCDLCRRATRKVSSLIITSAMKRLTMKRTIL